MASHPLHHGVRGHPSRVSRGEENGALRKHPRLSFDPRNMQTPLLVWVRADLSTTMNGSTVSGWADMSGNGRDFAQATAGNQPALSGSGQGGRAELVFDGADSMTGSSLFPMLSNASEWTLVMVLGQGWSDTGASGAYQNSPGIITASDSAGYFGAGIVSSDGPGGGIYNAGYKESAPPPGAIQSAGDPCIFVLYSDSGIKSRLNGSAGSTATGAAMLSGATTLEIGDSAAGHSDEPYDGPMSEVMIFDGTLQNYEIKQVEQYLGDRYNIRLNG